jgi:hypothetical protein
MKIKAGQVYTDGVSTYKILGVADSIIFVSAPDAYESSNSYYTTTEFNNSGLTLVPGTKVNKKCEREIPFGIFGGMKRLK